LKYALFLGCKIPAGVPAYASSMRAVLQRLGVELVELEFTCCGYPARRYSRDAFVCSAVRNLALAERAGLNLLTPCECCYGTLRQASRFMREDARLAALVSENLAEEGLAWSGRGKIEHLLHLLVEGIGMDALSAAIRAPRSDMRVAVHYGCHALRPSDVTQFDHPLAPTLFETLIGVTGARSVEWERRLDCCGDPLHTVNAPLSELMRGAKIASAMESGAEILCTACPHCQLRLQEPPDSNSESPLQVLLFTQLLGLAMGLKPQVLGLAADGCQSIQHDNNQQAVRGAD